MIGGGGHELMKEHIEGCLGTGVGKAISDSLGLASLQASGRPVGPIAEGVDRLHHLGSRLRGHQVRCVEDI